VSRPDQLQALGHARGGGGGAPRFPPGGPPPPPPRAENFFPKGRGGPGGGGCPRVALVGHQPSPWSVCRGLVPATGRAGRWSGEARRVRIKMLEASEGFAAAGQHRMNAVFAAGASLELRHCPQPESGGQVFQRLRPVGGMLVGGSRDVIRGAEVWGLASSLRGAHPPLPWGIQRSVGGLAFPAGMAAQSDFV